MFTDKINLLLLLYGLAFLVVSCQTNKKITQQKSIPKKIEQTEDVPSFVRASLKKEKSFYYQTIIAEEGPVEASNIEVVFYEQENYSHMSMENKPSQIVDRKPHQQAEKKPDKKIQNPALVNEITLPADELNYSVVTGSFTKRNYAVEMAKEFTEKGYQNVCLRFTKGFYRVVVEKFEEEKPAREFLLKFKNENPMFADAWLYIDD